MPGPVLLLGAEPRVAVTIARSLHKRKVPVTVATVTSNDVRVVTRAVQDWVQLPDYRQLPAACVEALVALLTARRFDMLLPTTDTALAIVVEHYGTLKGRVRLASPEAAIVRRVLDKDVTLETARSCGVPVPLSYEIPNLAQLTAIGSELRFPLVAKPRSKMGTSAHKVRYFQNLEALRCAFESAPQFGADNIIQEFASGEAVGMGVLIHNSNPVAMFQHRRLKELPATGGVSVMAISEPLDPTLTEHSLSLLRALRWEGMAMVEFKHDRHADRHLLIEVNGRYWGSIGLAVQAGVDFPLYHWQIINGHASSYSGAYKVGVRWRWLAGDLLRLHRLLRKRDPDSTGRFSVRLELGRYLLDFRPGVRDALWCFRDPVPAVAEFLQTFKPIAKEEIAQIAKHFLPQHVFLRLKTYRALGAPYARIYLARQIKRAFGIHRDRHRHLPRRVQSVLFACHGNIIRSPMAAAMLKEQMRRLGRNNVQICSAGTHAKAGKPADAKALVLCKEFGADLNFHRAQAITQQMLEQADLIIVMDFVNEARVLAVSPKVRDKTFMLGGFRPPENWWSVEIGDPYEAGIPEVRRCYSLMEECVRRLAKDLVARIPG